VARDGKTVDATLDAFEPWRPTWRRYWWKCSKAAALRRRSILATMLSKIWWTASRGLYLFGHGGSLVDAFCDLDLYHSRYVPPKGMSSDAGHFSRL